MPMARGSRAFTQMARVLQEALHHELSSRTQGRMLEDFLMD
jgi:hypothetical protein